MYQPIQGGCSFRSCSDDLDSVVLWLIDLLESGGFGSLEELVDCNFAGLEAPRLQLALRLWCLSWFAGAPLDLLLCSLAVESSILFHIIHTCSYAVKVLNEIINC
jgi:hypothetical protein